MKFIKSLALLMISLLLTMTTSQLVNATVIDELECLIMYKSGKYIYYISEGTGTNKIIKYNTKTEKKKVLLSAKLKNYETQRFTSITGKGKYIYFSWDRAKKGELYENEYIYRMTKGGKEIKRLGVGRDVVIQGNRIYYNKNKKIKENGRIVTEHTEKHYSMKLDGSDKRKEKNVKIKARSGGGYEMASFRTVTKGKYICVMDMNSFGIINKNTRKEKKIMSFDKKDRCIDFYVSKDYVMFRKTRGKYLYAYIVNINGKALKRLYKVKLY